MAQRRRDTAEAGVGDHEVAVLQQRAVVDVFVQLDVVRTPEHRRISTCPAVDAVARTSSSARASRISCRTASCPRTSCSSATRTVAPVPAWEPRGRPHARARHQEAPLAHRRGSLGERRLERLGHHRDEAILPGEELGPAADALEPGVGPQIVDRWREQWPILRHPRVGERGVHAVEQHSRWPIGGFSGADAGRQVGIDDQDRATAGRRQVAAKC